MSKASLDDSITDSVLDNLSGFYEDFEANTFGTKKKDTKRPLSNFIFQFTNKIVSSDPSSTGYLVEVVCEEPECDGDLARSRTCFFTSESTMKKDKFMQQLNFSHEGGLTCSFNDYQLAEFVQQKRRNAGRLQIKKAVETVGLQNDGSWVLGPSLYFNEYGQLVHEDSSEYIWISHLYNGPGIARRNTACPILLPLSNEPLQELYMWARVNMNHNYIPCMLVAGSCAMALHYKKILDTFLFCPIPLAYSSKSGTGKTSSIVIGLGPTGAYPSRFVSRATYEKYSQLCSSSFLPLGVDDPKSKAAISDLVITLFNGAKEATIKHGEKSPHSMAVISSNFTTIGQEKYLSRCLLIEFQGPSLDITMTNYAKLPKLVEKSTSAVGHFIELGTKFIDQGIGEMDDVIIPKLRELFGDVVIPRVLPSYAILIWFTLEVGKLVSLNLEKEVYDHFKDIMTPTIIDLQSSSDHNSSSHVHVPEMSIDSVGEEIIQCCNGLQLYEIWQFLRTDLNLNNESAVSIRIEDVPSLSSATKNFLSFKISVEKNIGAKARRYFLDENIDYSGKIINTISEGVTKQKRCSQIYMKYFSESIGKRLVEITSNTTSLTHNDQPLEKETTPVSAISLLEEQEITLSSPILDSAINIALPTESEQIIDATLSPDLENTVEEQLKAMEVMINTQDTSAVTDGDPLLSDSPITYKKSRKRRVENLNDELSAFYKPTSESRRCKK